MKTNNNLRIVILTSVVCLLPLIMSAIVYPDLPDQVAIHWDGSGNPDGFAPKALAAFGLPFLFVALNLFSKLRLLNDPKRAYTSQAMQLVAIWLPPLLSVILIPIMLLIALGKEIQITAVAPVLLGVILIVAGNYLPKSRQNYTIGIKLPWTLHDADNWNKTHRFAGYLYIIAGILVIARAFVGSFKLFGGISLITLLVLCLIVTPAVYSYLLFKRQNPK